MDGCQKSLWKYGCLHKFWFWSDLKMKTLRGGSWSYWCCTAKSIETVCWFWTIPFLLPALTAVTPAAENSPQAIAVERSDLLNSLVWTLLEQDDATSTDLVHSSHVHHTANLATLAELEDQQVTLDEHQPQEAAIETSPLQDTLEQDRKALFPFLTGDFCDLSTDMENFEFWHDGFLANGQQDFQQGWWKISFTELWFSEGLCLRLRYSANGKQTQPRRSTVSDLMLHNGCLALNSFSSI